MKKSFSFLFFLFSFFFLFFALCACSSANIKMLGSARSEISPNLVQLSAKVSRECEPIAILNTNANYNWEDKSELDFAILELKKMASSFGANTILLKNAQGASSEGFEKDGDIYFPLVLSSGSLGAYAYFCEIPPPIIYREVQMGVIYDD